MMLILGLDPGSLSFGIGIVSRERRRFAYVHSRTLRFQDRDFVGRMRRLLAGLEEVLADFPVEQAAMEEGFLGRNIRSMSLLSTVRGVAMAVLLRRGLPLALYAPRQVKQALTGYGNADKEQVAKMARLLLGLPAKRIGFDESDALAVAYCHGVHCP